MLDVHVLTRPVHRPADQEVALAGIGHGGHQAGRRARISVEHFECRPPATAIAGLWSSPAPARGIVDSVMSSSWSRTKRYPSWPSPAQGCSPKRSEAVPHGRGCTCGTDPWIQAKKGLAGRIPAPVRTRQPCVGDPRWARRVANAVLTLRVLMLQCRRVTGESLERPGSFLA